MAATNCITECKGWPAKPVPTLEHKPVQHLALTRPPELKTALCSSLTPLEEALQCTRSALEAGHRAQVSFFVCTTLLGQGAIAVGMPDDELQAQMDACQNSITMYREQCKHIKVHALPKKAPKCKPAKGNTSSV